MEPSKLVLVSAEANQVLVAESNSKCSCWSQPHFHLDYYSSQPQHKTLILTMIIPIGAVITPFQLKCPKSLDLILTMNSNQTYLNLMLD